MPVSGPISAQSTFIRQGFQNIKDFTQTVQSDPIQDVLKAAKESATKDSSDLDFSHRRVRNVKQRRAPPTPESPQPHRFFQPRLTPLFPPDPSQSHPVQLNSLPEYIRDYNQSHPHRLHIWTPTVRPDEHNLPDPVTVRFTIRDVLMVYLTLGTVSPNNTVIVESMTAFGPREKKPPHAQSSFSVYLRLSEHLAKMLQFQPLASLQLVLVLLASYEDLFIRRCSACERVTSSEGHVPPVARVWKADSREAGDGHWDARHPSCLQS